MPAPHIWTREANDLIRTMRQGGASWSAIALQLGVNRDTVTMRARQIGMRGLTKDAPKPEAPVWMEAWAVRAGAAPERAVESPRALYAFHPICIAALDAVFDAGRFSE